MGCETDQKVANNNLEEINNYNTWNPLSARKQMSMISLYFYLFIYFNVT